VQAVAEHLVHSERLSDVTLKGFSKPVTPHNVRGLLATSPVASP